jgi:hypothetical protein
MCISDIWTNFTLSVRQLITVADINKIWIKIRRKVIIAIIEGIKL